MANLQGRVYGGVTKGSTEVVGIGNQTHVQEIYILVPQVRLELIVYLYVRLAVVSDMGITPDTDKVLLGLVVW